MFNSHVVLLLLFLGFLLPLEAFSQDAFKLSPPAELTINPQSDVQTIDNLEKTTQSKSVKNTQVYSWPLYYKTRKVTDAVDFIDARCITHATHAIEPYMSGFLSGLYAKKKRLYLKWLKEEKFAKCHPLMNEAKDKAKFYTLMMKNTFPLSELSEKNVADLEGYYYATQSPKIFKKIQELSQTNLDTAPIAAKVLRTIERANSFDSE